MIILIIATTVLLTVVAFFAIEDEAPEPKFTKDYWPYGSD